MDSLQCAKLRFACPMWTFWSQTLRELSESRLAKKRKKVFPGSRSSLSQWILGYTSWPRESLAVFVGTKPHPIRSVGTEQEWNLPGYKDSAAPQSISLVSSSKTTRRTHGSADLRHLQYLQQVSKHSDQHVFLSLCDSSDKLQWYNIIH